jgi:hypothetical protein
MASKSGFEELAGDAILEGFGNECRASFAREDLAVTQMLTFGGCAD